MGLVPGMYNWDWCYQNGYWSEIDCLNENGCHSSPREREALSGEWRSSPDIWRRTIALVRKEGYSMLRISLSWDQCRDPLLVTERVRQPPKSEEDDPNLLVSDG